MGNPIYPLSFSKLNRNTKSNTTQTKPNLQVVTMGWPGHKTATNATSEDQVQKPMLPPSSPKLSLVEPERRRRPHRPNRALRVLRALCRTLPIFTPKCAHVPSPCKLVSNAHIASADFHPQTIGHTVSSSSSAVRITGTLFGYRKGRVSFSIQQNSRCLPSLVVELPIQTHTLLREIGSGMVRIALECEKQPDQKNREKPRLLEEPVWTMFCNGRKCGYGMRRDATQADLEVMETLSPVSMGAGVFPGRSQTEGADGELAYVRAYFEHVVGSHDSETLYMLSPDGRNGPELTIFFVRV